MHPSRRRKKRPNYGVRTVEVARGPNGFGFTISGQQPCILSCIVNHSPADQAGLRAGDFLISVNGVSVSKIAHDAVVSLIGNCVGPIKMTIAENYYSDSSDEELECGLMISNRKPKYTHKPRMNRRVYNKVSSETCEKNAIKVRECLEKQIEPVLNANIFNEEPASTEEPDIINSIEDTGPVEFRAIVGYLGTIEMPKQLLPNSRLQTVCSCIRKLRQEKRTPTPVLMTILPTCLTLKNSSNQILAIYPTNRVVYVGSTADKETRYFGLVTSAMSENRGQDVQKWQIERRESSVDSGIEVSNSCHVFVTDPKVTNHNIHLDIAESFKIICSTDTLTGTCLEFPQNALYIINLIQTMYKLQSCTPGNKNEMNVPLVANSPQPSASSNSDSGIGFRDDCGNISDRILVVEFPAHHVYPVLNNNNRPQGIDGSAVSLDALDVPFKRDMSQNLKLNNVRCNALKSNKLENVVDIKQVNNINNIRACDIKNHAEKSECFHKQNNVCNEYNRLTCRAIIDSNNKSNNNYTSEQHFQSISLKNVPGHSADNSIHEYHNSKDSNICSKLETSAKPEFASSEDIFRAPFETRKLKKHLKSVKSCENIDKSTNDSCKVFENSNMQLSYDELHNSEHFEKHGYGSLQNLSWQSQQEQLKRNIAQSEPDIRINRTGYLCDHNSESINGNKNISTGGPSSWTTTFEKLLEDPVGLHAFAEFLKKEFSAENIYFWTACERYARMPEASKRATEAQRIFKQHLAIGASEAVNVDAQGRQTAEHGLVDAEMDLFEVAQKQIFNLMKFDSYPRFLKSQLYKQCLAGENAILEFDPRLIVAVSPNTPTTKLKKSLSNAEDRRRKSLLPWHRKSNNHQRSKSRDREDIIQKECDGFSAKPYGVNFINDADGAGFHSSQSSLTSLDFVLSTQDNPNQMMASSYIKTALCRVKLSNGSTTVVQIRDDETIQQLVQRLLDKRGLVYSSFEVFTNKHQKGLNVSEPSSKLAGCEVTVEQRVVFKLDLPNRKIISVKSRYSKIIVDVLKPILHKYKFSLEQVTVARGSCPVDVSLPVTSIDGDRLNIILKEDVNMIDGSNSNALTKVNNVGVKKLEEITNKLFEGILQEKSDFEAFKPPKSDKGSVKSEDWGSEHSSGIFGKFLRRDSAIHERKKKLATQKMKPCPNNGNREEVTSENILKKPLIAKLKVCSTRQMAYSESDELVEGLTRAQRRLEDQRGTEINFELPDFLKDKDKEKFHHSFQNGNCGNRYYLPNSGLKISPVKNLQLGFSNYENQNVLISRHQNASTNHNLEISNMGCTIIENKTNGSTDPPPLPPKPKVLPIKPPNWGHSDIYKSRDTTLDIKQEIFLDQPSSSFV